MPREVLTNSLVKEGYLKTPSIIEAFKKIDRADFIPENQKKEAYGNYPLPIGFGQTISQPLTVAFMLELLEPKLGEKILDIGSGSGWQAALLSCLVGEHGRVISIERIPELRNFAEENLKKIGILNSVENIPVPDSSGVEGVAESPKEAEKLIEIKLGDGTEGDSANTPFDKIIAAAAGKSIPIAWKQQLKIGGRIVAPVKESIVVLDKKGPNEFEEKRYFGFSFVPLVTGAKP